MSTYISIFIGNVFIEFFFLLTTDPVWQYLNVFSSHSLSMYMYICIRVWLCARVFICPTIIVGVAAF
jgi:hypothetical protein